MGQERFGKALGRLVMGKSVVLGLGCLSICMVSVVEKGAGESEFVPGACAWYCVSEVGVGGVIVVQVLGPNWQQAVMDRGCVASGCVLLPGGAEVELRAADPLDQYLCGPLQLL